MILTERCREKHMVFYGLNRGRNEPNEFLEGYEQKHILLTHLTCHLHDHQWVVILSVSFS